MKTNIKNLFSVILILVSIAAVSSNIIVFRNYKVQKIVIEDNSKGTPELSLSEAQRYNFSYPNINVFTIPFKTYLGRIYLRDSMFVEAVSNFHQAKKHNPYLRINENYLAETYDILKVKDSFKYYSEIAYSKMPNNGSHFMNYIKSIGPHNDTYKIDSIFNLQKSKPLIVWQLYLSSLVEVKNKSLLAKDNFEKASKLFPKEETIETLIAYNISGIKAVKSSLEYASVADQLALKGNYKGAIEVLIKALKLHSNNNNYEKIATSYFKLKDYKSSLKYLDSFDLHKNFPKGRYYLIRGVALCELGEKEEGCNELTNAMINKNPQAQKAKKIYCK